MFCRGCGAQLEAGDVFCSNCGKPRTGAPVSAAPAPSAATAVSTPSAAKTSGLSLETICGGVLILAFFLPWVGAMGLSISGFEIAKAGSQGTIAWLVPLAGAATVAAGLMGKPQAPIARIAGLVPAGVLIFFLAQSGTVNLSGLSLGLYLAVGTGLAMTFLLPRRTKRA